MCLIEKYFPDRRPEYAEPPYAYVVNWLNGRLRPFRLAALALIALIRPILEELSTGEDRHRRPRIDDTTLIKPPESILDKMIRGWDPVQATQPPRYTFESFTTELHDLGRFRIVANFLSDVYKINEALAKPYRDRAVEELSIPQRRLQNDFHLLNNQFEDSILQRPRERSKGERCYKGVFYPCEPGQSHLKVEVQIQTMLQEAWDKKDHFLIYEPRRRGEEINPHHEAEMFAMSELLYVADLTFDRLREEIVGKEAQHASP